MKNNKKNPFFKKFSKIVFFAIIISLMFVGCESGDDSEDTQAENPQPEQTDSMEFIITANPISTSYAIGDVAEPLTVDASGLGSLEYQWLETPQNSNSIGSEIQGAGSKSFTPPTEELGESYYFCIVTLTTPDNVTQSLKTEVATITVLEEAEQQEAEQQAAAQTPSTSGSTSSYSSGLITKQPVGGSVVAGEPMTLSISASGNVSYQWYTTIYNETTYGVKLEGQRANTLAIQTGAPYSQYYYCVVTNNSTGYSATSNLVHVAILDKPSSATPTPTPSPTPGPTASPTPTPSAPPIPTISSHPISADYTAGSTTLINGLYIVAATPSSGSLSYQWYDGNGNKINGAVGDHYAPTIDLNNPGTHSFYCVVTNNENGLTSDTRSNTAIINLVVR